jgi:hypothetical protein
VDEAQANVTPPRSESVAQQHQGLVEDLGKRAAPNPAIEKLCADIYDIIKGLRPKHEEDLVHADPEGMAQKAGDQVKGNVQGGVDQVHQGYASLDEHPPGTEPAPGQAIPPPPDAAAAPPIQASQAKPDAIPPQNVSLDADVKDSQGRLDQAGMSTEPAKLVQEGSIADARAAQGDLQEAAKEDPAKILAAQQAAFDKAGADMDALQQASLKALVSSRHGTTHVNLGHQKSMARTEEQERADASREATETFNQTRDAVDPLLRDLAKNAMAKWKAGVTKAKGVFKDRLKDEDARIRERHSGFTGWFKGKWDKWTGLPDWVTEDYDKAEKEFGDAICDLARDISVDVETVVVRCEGIITDGRTHINGIFDKLAKKYPDWVASEKAKFGKQLDGLSQRAHTVRDNFNKELIRSATEAMEEVHDELEARREEAKGILGRIADAIKDFIKDPIRTIINGLLSLLGIPKAAFWAVVEKIKKVISDIADDPLGFAKNLLKAVGQGFSLFFDHIVKHLAEGFIDWFTGGLASAGVELPKDFSLGSIMTFLLQLMGITWARIRKLFVKHVGEQNVEVIESAWSMVSTLIAMGPVGIFEWIKDKLDPQHILDQIVDMAVDFIESALIKAVTARIIMLFNPVGAILQAIEAIYRVLKWIFVNAGRIFKLIETVVNGIADILAGNIGAMASAVEKALVSLIAPVIDFLADYFQFGDLPDKVRDTIIRFQNWVEGILDKAIGWLVDKAKNSAVGRMIAGMKPKEKPAAEPAAKEGDRNVDAEADVDGEHHVIRLHRGHDGVKLMMASSQFKAFNDQLTAIEEHHLPHLTGDSARQFSEDIGKIREEAARIESDASKTKEKPGMNADEAASASQAADRVAGIGITGLKQQLAKLGPKYASAEAANLKADDPVIIEGSPLLGGIVNQVGVLTDTRLGIKVTMPYPMPPRVLYYVDFKTKWRRPRPGEPPQPGKPVLKTPHGQRFGISGSAREMDIGNPLNPSDTNPQGPVPGLDATYNHKGHLIANRFWGPNHSRDRNLVAMTETTNLSRMKVVENRLASDIEQHDFVIKYRVTPVPDVSRPADISFAGTKRIWPPPETDYKIGNVPNVP